MTTTVNPYHALKLVMRKKVKPQTAQEGSFVTEMTIPEKPIRIKRRSLLTGKVHAMVLPISVADVSAYLQGGVMLQNAFPSLSPSQREFIKTGITPKEWEEYFGKPEE
jgi:hypothetical protein